MTKHTEQDPFTIGYYESEEEKKKTEDIITELTQEEINELLYEQEYPVEHLQRETDKALSCMADLIAEDVPAVLLMTKEFEEQLTKVLLSIASGVRRGRNIGRFPNRQAKEAAEKRHHSEIDGLLTKIYNLIRPLVKVDENLK